MPVLGGVATLPQITLGSSQTFTAPQDGNICIHVVGAGGGGTGLYNEARAGGAGGYSKKNSLAVTSGQTFTVVVGAGGDGGDGGNGADGGNSTVAGGNLSSTLTANGGSGGTSSAHGSGGAASNGDVNRTGGAGNSGGGGAVGVFGTGNSSDRYGESQGAGMSDVNGGGLACSGFGHIVGGPAGDAYRQHFTGVGDSGGLTLVGGDLSGGGQHNRNALANSSFHCIG